MSVGCVTRDSVRRLTSRSTRQPTARPRPTSAPIVTRHSDTLPTSTLTLPPTVTSGKFAINCLQHDPLLTLFPMAGLTSAVTVASLTKTRPASRDTAWSTPERGPTPALSAQIHSSTPRVCAATGKCLTPQRCRTRTWM